MHWLGTQEQFFFVDSPRLDYIPNLAYFTYVHVRSVLCAGICEIVWDRRRVAVLGHLCKCISCLFYFAKPKNGLV